MRPIDEDFLDAVENDHRAYVHQLKRDEQAPFLDIEVLRRPHLDGAELSDRFVDRIKRLRASLSGEAPSDLLVAYGERVVEPPGAAPDTIFEPLLRGLSPSDDGRVKRLLTVPDLGAGNGAERDVAAVFRVTEPVASTAAYVAVIGLAVKDRAVDGGPAAALVERLALGVARTAPLYVIGVVPRDLLAGGTPERERLLRLCQRLRMSIVLHDGAGRHDLVAMTGTEMRDRGGEATQVSLISCPTTKTGEGLPGLTRLRIDVWRGEAEIAFRHDLGSDREPMRPVQVLRTLVSASRVRASERRLFVRVHELLAQHPHDDREVREFRAYVKRAWADWGYVALCDANGNLPKSMVPTRRIRYHLLLLLRERDEGGYEILLSHHTPVHSPAVGHWDTLLLPAFRDVRSLLERLRDDVTRQAIEQSGDVEKSQRARSFETAVNRLIGGESPDDEDVWATRIREIGTIIRNKISPTNGCVTEYDYRLVTLLPFIERDAHDDENVSKLVQWLDDLEVVREPNDALSGGLGLEALVDGGAGLRWDPEVELGERPGGQRRRRKVPPGAVWFPLVAENPRWRACPSIVTRNVDVMTWVERELKLRRQDGVYPPELLLGKASPASATFSPVGTRHPFADTVKALSKVELGFLDLAGQPAYPDDPDVRRVMLVRRDRRWFGQRSPLRGAIFVIDADEYARDPDTEQVLGTLRPIQRYVLTAGLKRAAEIYRDVLKDLIENGDPWGYVWISRGGASGSAVLTPPILERLHPMDWDDPQSEHDFLVCDGNHRVVHNVWNQRIALPAVAVMSEPREPYYARPFGRLEWDATAENEQKLTPQLRSKYLPRRVDPKALKLGPDARAILANVAPDEWYRRYFRDLTRGFGYLGGQGGRYV